MVLGLVNPVPLKNAGKTISGRRRDQRQPLVVIDFNLWTGKSQFLAACSSRVRVLTETGNHYTCINFCKKKKSDWNIQEHGRQLV
jgi:hypothetical protein